MIRNPKWIKKNVLGKSQSFLIIPPQSFKNEVFELLRGVLEKPLSLPIKELIEKGAYPKIFEHPLGLMIEDISFKWIYEIVARSYFACEIYWMFSRKHKASGFSELKKSLKNLDIESYLLPDRSNAVSIKTHQSDIYHKKKIKGLLEKSFEERGFRFESEGPKGYLTKQRLLAFFYESRFDLGVSISGSPFFMRKYKKPSYSVAPLREDIAFLLVQLTFSFSQEKLDSGSHITIVLPFVGSGTLFLSSIEYLTGYGVCEGRLEWLKESPFYSKPAYCNLQKLIKSDAKCIEIDLKACDLLELSSLRDFLYQVKSETPQIKNIETVQSDVKDFRIDLPKDYSGAVFIPLNPPYGVRLKDSKSVIDVYDSVLKLIESIKTDFPKARVFGFVLSAIPAVDRKIEKFFHSRKNDWKLKSYKIKQGGMPVDCNLFASTE